MKRGAVQGRGECPGCRRIYAMRADGTVRGHSWNGRWCAGSRRPPPGPERPNARTAIVNAYLAGAMAYGEDVTGAKEAAEQYADDTTRGLREG